MLIAIMLEGMLAALDLEIAAMTANLDEALAVARREPFDLAILDVNIKGKEIYPVAEVLAARQIPFAFSTGYGQRSLRAPYQDRPILGKPVEPGELRKVIAELTGSRGPKGRGPLSA